MKHFNLSNPEEAVGLQVLPQVSQVPGPTPCVGDYGARVTLKQSKILHNKYPII